jgi:hypothetical protein
MKANEMSEVLNVRIEGSIDVRKRKGYPSDTSLRTVARLSG